MLKNCLLLLSFLTIFNIYSSDNITFKLPHKNINLKSSEIQILANYLFISYCIAQIDSKINTISQELLSLSMKIRKDVLNYKLTNYQIVKIQFLTKYLKIIYEIRKLILENNEKILSSINNNLSLKNIVYDIETEMQYDISNLLNKDEINKLLMNSKDILESQMPTLNMISKTQQSIIDGKYLFTPTKGFESLFWINELIKIAAMGLNSNIEITKSNEKILNLINTVYTKTKEIISKYYTLTYSLMVQHKFEDKFMTMLFIKNKPLPYPLDLNSNILIKYFKKTS